MFILCSMILPSTINDIDRIFTLYSAATAYMDLHYHVSWPQFEREMVRNEINQQRQFKMIVDDQIACIWAITFDDPDIWEERNSDPAIYIHRIATDPSFRGQRFVSRIVEWAKQYALEHQKKYIRLDTVGENQKLIAHYQRCGFTYLGLVTLKDVTMLPEHYSKDKVSLFEIVL